MVISYYNIIMVEYDTKIDCFKINEQYCTYLRFVSRVICRHRRLPRYLYYTAAAGARRRWPKTVIRCRNRIDADSNNNNNNDKNNGCYLYTRANVVVVASLVRKSDTPPAAVVHFARVRQ